MSEITITIPGKPIAKMRPRFARRGKFVSTYNCQETEEGKVRWEMMNQFQSIDTIAPGIPIKLECIFYMPIPSGMSQKKLHEAQFRHIKKPDCDNLIKFVKDCANGVIWADDSQVFEVHARKLYASQPRTEMMVRW